MAGGWNTAGLIVEVGGDVVLQQFPKILNNQLWRTLVTVFTESLVDSQNIDQLVGQVVLRTVAAFQCD